MLIISFLMTKLAPKPSLLAAEGGWGWIRTKLSKGGVAPLHPNSYLLHGIGKDRRSICSGSKGSCWSSSHLEYTNVGIETTCEFHILKKLLPAKVEGTGSTHLNNNNNFPEK
ncbi:hypothetical protein Ahia01_000249600 [Argonauta hians]